jgi:signal transduction histidine kinase
MRAACPSTGAGPRVSGYPRGRRDLGGWPGSWWLAMFIISVAWLILSGIVLRFTNPTNATVFLVAIILLSASDEFLDLAWGGFPPRRKLTGHALAVLLAVLLALVFARLPDLPGRGDLLALLLAVVAVALVGGLIPALIEAVAGSLLCFFLGTAQPGTSAAAPLSGVVMLGVLLGVAVTAGLLAEHATRRARRPVLSPGADVPVADTARMRTALLAGVSQNLRPPLAAAQSAVGYLRRVPGAGLTADDYDELLATVEQSLGQIARLAATMRDASQSPPAPPKQPPRTTSRHRRADRMESHPRPSLHYL